MHLNISELRKLRIRSTHADSPYPGQIATVYDILETKVGGQWLECYIARFENGFEWYCPIMATKDYERVP